MRADTARTFPVGQFHELPCVVEAQRRMAECCARASSQRLLQDSGQCVSLLVAGRNAVSDLAFQVDRPAIDTGERCAASMRFKQAGYGKMKLGRVVRHGEVMRVVETTLPAGMAFTVCRGRRSGRIAIG